GWGDTLIDALCEPPESFVLGSVLAHVLTYSAHRRLLARHWLRGELPDAANDYGDPIMWLRQRG
ncbi:AraC family transcriptional regulator, partial [Nocardia gipuzkoensis]